MKVLFKTNTTHSSQVARWLLVATRACETQCLTTLSQQRPLLGRVETPQSCPDSGTVNFSARDINSETRYQFHYMVMK